MYKLCNNKKIVLQNNFVNYSDLETRLEVLHVTESAKTLNVGDRFSR